MGANEHPPPWRWVEDEEPAPDGSLGWGLFAANGRPVLDADGAPWSDEVRALIASAPETARERDEAVELIRRLFDAAEKGDRGAFEDRLVEFVEEAEPLLARHPKEPA